MSKTKALYKTAIFSYLVDPLFYAASLLLIFFSSFRFFFGAKFFVAGLGSSDLRAFFNSVPYISILTVPLLSLRVRPLMLDDSIPISPFRRFLSLNLASFSTFAAPILLMLSLPLCVFRFGFVDFFQCLSGVFGIFLYGFCAVSLCAFLFALFAFSTALPLILSAVILSLVTFAHLLPLYVKTGSALAFLCQAVSFAWHFDSFSKGILDSRNVFYYIIVSLSFIILSARAENARLGKKSSRLTASLVVSILILLSLSCKNLYARLDVTQSQQFSLSSASKRLLSDLEGNLRITYYRSTELKNLYPQTEDVAEFLADYASQNARISLTLEKADSEKLKALGIQGQQIRHENGTKTEFVTVYSVVLLQYLEKSTLIPFVLSTQTLEYDLTQRVQSLIGGKGRKVFLLCGNGRSLEESYLYVEPWLTARGFSVEALNDFTAEEVVKNLTAEDEIAVFGTANLPFETASALMEAVEKGTKAFFATSPFHTTIEDEWKISKSAGDPLISFLNGKGFAFENALVEDISCYPLTMESGEGATAEYATVNYPLWVVLQNQREARRGATVFWASPIALYGGAEGLLYTTNLAWTQKPAQSDDGNLFLTNPFLIPKSASQSDAETGTHIVAARNKNISLVADQFFVSSLMTGFISGESSGDFRNYDYLTKELLVLRGEEELAALMEKAAPVTSLYKIVDEEAFRTARTETIAIMFILLPAIVIVLFACVQWKRKRGFAFKNEKISLS